MKFKEFLLNESTVVLNQKMGDILNALQELSQDSKQIGTRSLIKNSELIVNKMRGLLHQTWPQSKQKDIKLIQKCAIALMKAIDEKSDLEEVINKVIANLQNVGSSTPINNLGTPEGIDIPQKDPKDASNTSLNQSPPMSQQSPPMSQQSPPMSQQSPPMSQQSPPMGQLDLNL
jgi:hypothetical protein